VTGPVVIGTGERKRSLHNQDEHGPKLMNSLTLIEYNKCCCIRGSGDGAQVASMMRTVDPGLSKGSGSRKQWQYNSSLVFPQSTPRKFCDIPRDPIKSAVQ